MKISAVNTLVSSLDGLNKTAIIMACDNISVGFVNGTMNSSICQWFTSIGVTQILSLRTPRRLHHSWNKSSVTVHHKEYGGVTDSVATFYFLSQIPIKMNDMKHLLHTRDAHTIIDDSVWCLRQRRRPAPVATHPLSVVNVCASSSPVFHVGGLLPLSSLKRCTIITPAIGLKKHVWGIRELTPTEILHALDFSPDLLPPTLVWQEFVHKNAIPGMCWVIGALTFLHAGVNTPFEETIQPRLGKRLKISTLCPPPLGACQDNVVCIVGSVHRNQSAVKSDDAGVDTNIWFGHFLDGGEGVTWENPQS